MSKKRILASLKELEEGGIDTSQAKVLTGDSLEDWLTDALDEMHFKKNIYFIVWPGHFQEPLMWAGAPHWRTGHFGEQVLAGEDLGGFAFSTWYSGVVDALHWANHPGEQPPKGWRKASHDEIERIKESTQAPLV